MYSELSPDCYYLAQTYMLHRTVKYMLLESYLKPISYSKLSSTMYIKSE
jgi:hypothetical protein